MLLKYFDFKQLLLATQLYIHAAFLIGLVLIPVDMILPSLIISHIIYVGLCGTVFYHRIVTHRNKINDKLSKFLMLLSWLGASGSLIGWAGTHRKHHTFSDTERDPHSPKYLGYIKTYWWSSGGNDIVKFVPDLLRNPWYLWQHKNYFNVLFLAHGLGLIFLPWAWYWCIMIVPGFLMWFGGSMTNCFSHNKQGPNNNILLGLLFGGEGWHKNHHNDPANASFGHRLDWGNWIYKLITYRKSQSINV